MKNNTRKPPNATRYIAEFPLFVLARAVTTHDGRSGWEPQIIHGVPCGLAVYVSPLDAEIIRAQRIASGEKGWRRFALEDLDVLQMAAGQDSMMCCLVFGFGATADGRLKAQSQRLQPVHYPVNFAGLRSEDAPNTNPQDHEPVTLNFERRLFDSMRGQWESIGAQDYEREIGRINKLSAMQLTHAASGALRAGAPSEADYGDVWGVFHASNSRWACGAATRHVVNA